MSDMVINFLKLIYDQRVNDYVLGSTTDVSIDMQRVNSLLGILRVTHHTFHHTLGNKSS